MSAVRFGVARNIRSVDIRWRRDGHRGVPKAIPNVNPSAVTVSQNGGSSDSMAEILDDLKRRGASMRYEVSALQQGRRRS